MKVVNGCLDLVRVVISLICFFFLAIFFPAKLERILEMMNIGADPYMHPSHEDMVRAGMFNSPVKREEDTEAETKS